MHAPLRVSPNRRASSSLLFADRVLPALLVGALVVGVAGACAPARTPIDMTLPAAVPPAETPPFLATPWPSDLMTTSTGLDLSTIPNPFGSHTLEDAIQLIATNHAYAATGTLYFHVPGGVDESSLPQTPAASLAAGASMFLVQLVPHDLPGAQSAGVDLVRIPIQWKSFAAKTSFLPAGTIAVQPLLGAVPRTRFALVVTSNARAKDGSSLGPSADMLALSRCDKYVAPRAGTRAVDCTPYRALVDALHVPPEDVALAQIVTPEDATGGLVDAATYVHKLGPPVLSALTKRAQSPSAAYDVYDGTASIAQLQAGEPPFEQLDVASGYKSGGFQFDAKGQPIIQRFDDVPFIVTVPKTAPPSASGYCIVLYGHGTGGNKESGIDDGTADELAQTNCAMIGAPEPLHEGRAGYQPGQEDVLTFNFFNPVAGRDNWRQSAIEKVQWTLLAETLVIPASTTGAADIRFDPKRLAYFGHSQGGIAGALFVAVDRDIKAAFLSGAGGGFQASLVLKTDPPPAIADVLKLALNFPTDNSEPVDLFHPVIALLQTWVDPADPINYGGLWHDRLGDVPSLALTSGLKDTFTPPPCHAALAASWGVPLVKPVAKDLEVLDLVGPPPVGPVAHDDLTVNDGSTITAGMLQYPDDGHFAVFENPDAQAAFRQFFSTFQTGTPTIQVHP